jgi:hypothetical protein
MPLDPNVLHAIIIKGIEESPKINQMDSRLTRVEDRLTKGEDRLTKGEDRLGSIEQEFHEFRLIQEDMQQTLRVITDAVIPAQKRGEQIEQISDAVDNHEIRITVVEDVVKDHLNEKA